MRRTFHLLPLRRRSLLSRTDPRDAHHTALAGRARIPMRPLNPRLPLSRSQVELSPTWWSGWSSRMGTARCAALDGPHRTARMPMD